MTSAQDAVWLTAGREQCAREPNASTAAQLSCWRGWVEDRTDVPSTPRLPPLARLAGFAATDPDLATCLCSLVFHIRVTSVRSSSGVSACRDPAVDDISRMPPFFDRLIDPRPSLSQVTRGCDPCCSATLETTSAPAATARSNIASGSSTVNMIRRVLPPSAAGLKLP
jgi:hypothetical protein